MFSCSPVRLISCLPVRLFSFSLSFSLSSFLSFFIVQCCLLFSARPPAVSTIYLSPAAPHHPTPHTTWDTDLVPQHLYRGSVPRKDLGQLWTWILRISLVQNDTQNESSRLVQPARTTLRLLKRYTYGHPADDRTPGSCYCLRSSDVIQNAVQREAQVDDARRTRIDCHTSPNAKRVVLLKVKIVL